VLVRASGTEPLVRVMVEAEDDAVANDAVAELIAAAEAAASRMSATSP
jgi:phosphomannomutase